jgi:hypothetical protein
MSELKPTCCAGVSHNGWSRGVCGKPSKIEHKGKHYCEVHNPVKRKEKQDKRDAEMRAEWAAKDAARDAAKAKQAELERRAGCYDELLEALKNLANIMIAFEDDGSKHAFQAAKQAIAKAEGKQT